MARSDLYLQSSLQVVRYIDSLESLWPGIAQYLSNAKLSGVGCIDLSLTLHFFDYLEYLWRGNVSHIDIPERCLLAGINPLLIFLDVDRDNLRVYERIQ